MSKIIKIKKIFILKRIGQTTNFAQIVTRKDHWAITNSAYQQNSI